MTAREAILRAVPAFVAIPQRDDYALRRRLEEDGVPRELAAEIAEFVPLAVARALLDGMGVRFSDEYVRQTSQGRVIGRKRLDDEPVFREATEMADEIVRMGQDSFMAVAGWSVEYRHVRAALNSGATAGDLRYEPPVVTAVNEDAREFDDTSGGVQDRGRSWWQFWRARPGG
jgi:hypothetical protein